MSHSMTRKRSFSEVSNPDEEQKLAKTAKTNEHECVSLESAQARTKQLEQTIELARSSLRNVVGSFDKVPKETLLKYLQTISDALDGGSEGVKASDVADARIAQIREDAIEFYTVMMKKIDVVYNQLDNRSSVTADDYAEAMANFIPLVNKLLLLGPEGVVNAFKIIMYMSCRVYGDLDRKGGSGYGGSERPYRLLDEKLLEIIELRKKQEADVVDPKVWEDALSELVTERDLLDEYGLEDYFKRSIARLQELTGKTGKENKQPASAEGDSGSSDSHAWNSALLMRAS